MSGPPSRIARLVLAAFLVVPAFVLSVSATSAAAPSKQQVEAAKQRLAQLQTQFEASVERWNNAKYELEQAQGRLADAKAMKDAADKDAAAARAALAQRAVDAYTGMGSDLDVLLGAQSFSEFSDRLEFMGAIAQSDSDLAAQADAAGQRAAWAAQQYSHAVSDAQTHLTEMTSERQQIQSNLAEQQTLAVDLSAQYQAAIVARDLFGDSVEVADVAPAVGRPPVTRASRKTGASKVAKKVAKKRRPLSPEGPAAEAARANRAVPRRPTNRRLQPPWLARTSAQSSARTRARVTWPRSAPPPGARDGLATADQPLASCRGDSTDRAPPALRRWARYRDRLARTPDRAGRSGTGACCSIEAASRPVRPCRPRSSASRNSFGPYRLVRPTVWRRPRICAE